jgi:hypothetical protein
LGDDWVGRAIRLSEPISISRDRAGDVTEDHGEACDHVTTV